MKKIILLSIILIVGCEGLLESIKEGCMDSKACNYDADATIDKNSCEYELDCAGVCGRDTVEDCNGVCGGSAVLDECSVCDGNGAEEGLDCDGGCLGGVDCAGVCRGDVVYDNCGVCDNDTTNDCTVDCNGDFGGYAILDNCGTCDADTTNYCVQDCANVWGGNAVEDNCGTCDADTTNDCVLTITPCDESFLVFELAVYPREFYFITDWESDEHELMTLKIINQSDSSSNTYYIAYNLKIDNFI